LNLVKGVPAHTGCWRYFVHSEKNSSVMLVLTRKIGESFVIPANGLTITVLGVVRNKVRLGVAGPREIAVHREEVWLSLQALGEDDAQQGAAAAAGLR
jgi:carbon storage regulator